MAQAISRRSIVYDILFDVQQGRASAAEAQRALERLERQARQTGNVAGQIGSEIRKAFAWQEVARQVSRFAQESFELGLKVEGVRRAFNKLNNPSLLNNLRAATKGTVDDLTLMQAAVRADKFKIPLANLAQYFKFAAQRARETGQEVNYLVNSIIDGIGKGTTQQLDNLGFKIQDIRDEFAKTGDMATAVANVISVEMKKSGDEIDLNADKVERLRTGWQNFKITVGEALTTALDFYITNTNAAAGLINKQKELAEIQERNNQAIAAGANLFSSLAPKVLEPVALSLDEITEKLKELNQEFSSTTDPQLRERLAQQIIALEKMKKAIEDLLNPIQKIKRDLEGITALPFFEAIQIKEADISPAIETLDKLEEQLSKLQEQFEKTFTGSPEFEALKQQIKDLQDRIAQLRGEATATTEAIKISTEGIANSFSTIFGNLAELSKSSSNAQIAFSFANIIAANAEALAKSIASAASIPWPGNIPAILSSIATITSVFAGVNSIMNQAKTAQSSANAVAFAEGEVDIHRPGETRGKDSISAKIMPGESVITTEATSQYKPFLQAIQEGTLEDLIKVNYVEPALALKALESARSDSTQVDYSDRFYRQLLATGEGNLNGKRAVRILSSIDKKLSTGKSNLRN